MTEQIPFTAEQLTDLAAGKPVTVLVAMEQPPEGYEVHTDGKIAFCKPCNRTDIDICWMTKLPHPVGSTVKVRREWRVFNWICEGEIRVEFRDGTKVWLTEDTAPLDAQELWIESSDECIAAGIPLDKDYCYVFSDEHPCPMSWRSPDTMPDELIMRPKVTACEVNRTLSLTPEEISSWGYKLIVNKAQGLWGSELHQVYNAQHGPGSWEENPFVCVITMEVKK